MSKRLEQIFQYGILDRQKERLRYSQIREAEHAFDHLFRQLPEHCPAALLSQLEKAIWDMVWEKEYASFLEGLRLGLELEEAIH